MAKTERRSTKRFSDRVDDYVRFRPNYPGDVVRTLKLEVDIDPGLTRIVDIGCGTGISSQLFLDAGYSVVGVEPNAPMRAAALRLVSSYPRYRVIDGRAEATSLEASSFELAVAAQSFHWFDRTAVRAEIERILVSTGVVALLWNERKVDASPFLQAYEAILQKYGTDYLQIDHRNVSEEDIAQFFGATGYGLRIFPNHQDLDLDGLIGRARSSSYIPGPNHPDYRSVVEALSTVFAQHASNGFVRIEYDTKLYFGRRSP